MKTTKSNRRWWDLPAAILLLAALLTAATRLVATEWTRHLDIVQSIVVIGSILGFALGQSRFSGRLSGFLGLIYGLIIVPWQLGLTLKSRFLWPEKISILGNRLSVIFYQLVNREVVQDSLLFLLLMAVSFWILSVLAGYTLIRRGNAWKAVIPTGIVIFAIHSFDPYISRRAWYLAFYVFFALVCIARIVYIDKQIRWRQSRTAIPPHLGLELIRVAFVATAVIVLMAWTAPALANALPAAEKAWRPVRRAWDITRDQFDNVFASLSTSVATTNDYYGRSALLGQGNLLTDTQVFSVDPAKDSPDTIRFYWRARNYDTYKNGQWLSTTTKSRPYIPDNNDYQFSRYKGRWIGAFQIIGATHISTLFTPPQPIWSNREAIIEFAENSDSTIDVSSLRATPALDEGQTYWIQSAVSNASIKQLQNAGIDYPEWITERYLQLPETITQRTYQLARDITADSETPYDKVVAINQYLRDNITYSDTIENPPADQDTIDWFLFSYRQGFCNYYSSSEIVMLRSLGIPARWAVGYAQGEKLENGTYVVRQKDAHAWPEVYFPGIGWIEFEPTVSQPEIIRLVEHPIQAAANTNSDMFDDREELSDLDKELEDPGSVNDFSDLNSQNRRVGQYLIWLIPIVSGIFILLVMWRFRNRINLPALPIILETSISRAGFNPPKTIQNWAKRAKLPPITKAYLEINNALVRLGNQAAMTDTPRERAENLGNTLQLSKAPANMLVTEYQIETFSTNKADKSIAVEASREIKKISYKDYLQRLIQRIRSPRRKSDHLLMGGDLNTGD
ncbi:transglutaminase domain-containing protein [Chloroflexota bacterium]